METEITNNKKRSLKKIIFAGISLFLISGIGYGIARVVEEEHKEVHKQIAMRLNQHPISPIEHFRTKKIMKELDEANKKYTDKQNQTYPTKQGGDDLTWHV